MQLLNSLLRGSGQLDALKHDADLANYLVDDESVDAAFKMQSGYLAVTGRRLLVVGKSGLGGKDYQSIPYARIGAFTATPKKGGFGLGGAAELRLRVQGVPDEVVLEFADNDAFLAVQRGLAALACPVAG
jgi:hypothetical protein